MAKSKNSKRFLDNKKRVRKLQIGKMSNKKKKMLFKAEMKAFNQYVKRRQFEDMLRQQVEELGQEQTVGEEQIVQEQIAQDEQ